jgi:hypothetical protein
MSLKAAAAVFIAGFLLHNADHARRGIDAVTDHVIWGGTAVAVAAAVVVTLVFTDHSSAPAAAAAGGLGIAVGVSATHLLPDWGVLSDPLLELSATSWVAVLAEVARSSWGSSAPSGRCRSCERVVARGRLPSRGPVGPPVGPGGGGRTTRSTAPLP